MFELEIGDNGRKGEELALNGQLRWLVELILLHKLYGTVIFYNTPLKEKEQLMCLVSMYLQRCLD